MINAAERMKSLGKRTQVVGAPSAVFGSAASLAQSVESEEAYRIGFYPIICPETPEVAMGLASCLCYLLDQFHDARVYRCFARTDGAGGAEVTASDYQFTIDAWELEGLADNIQVYGSLERAAGDYTFNLTMDIGLLSEEDVAEFSYHVAALQDLVSGLPKIATSVMAALAGSTNNEAIIGYAPTSIDTGRLERLLIEVFEWNLDVYLHFWGVDWAEADIQNQFAHVGDLANVSNDQFSNWCLGMIARQVMQTGLEDCGEVIATRVSQYFSNDAISEPGVAAAARGLAELGYIAQAVELLEPYLHVDSAASSWLSMIRIHLASGQLSEAIDTCQRALECGLDHPALTWEYSQLLINAEALEWPVEELLYVEPDDYAEHLQIPAEIANALKHNLSNATDNLGSLQLALAYMIDINDDDIWRYFELLVAKDLNGDFAADTIERLLDLEDRDNAYDILARATDANAYAHVFLAQLALADEDTDLAKTTIAACRQRLSEIDDELEIELQRLELSAQLLGFEETFAEIKLLLSSNRNVTEGQVEILEEAIKIAPKMIDIYVVLAGCYASWEDSEGAAEVLEEAERLAGAHPQIELGLARLLWETNERDAAISRLNSGLAAYPSDVNLLVQMANFLIANDQLDDARHYILRADTIAPSHRAIWQVRRIVAQKMAEAN